MSSQCPAVESLPGPSACKRPWSTGAGDGATPRTGRIEPSPSRSSVGEREPAGRLAKVREGVRSQHPRSLRVRKGADAAGVQHDDERPSHPADCRGQPQRALQRREDGVVDRVEQGARRVLVEHDLGGAGEYVRGADPARAPVDPLEGVELDRRDSHRPATRWLRIRRNDGSLCCAAAISLAGGRQCGRAGGRRRAPGIAPQCGD